jgi:hypothetical protein
MPNKYEREIEEILRNMDRPDSGPSFGDRIRAFNRPSPRPPVTGPRLRLRLNSEGSLLLLGIVLAFLGAGIRYYFGLPDTGLWAYVSGVIGFLALVFVVAGLVVGWSARFGHRPRSTWRGENVTRIRGGFHPFVAIATQFRIMRLKWRYWRLRGR